MLKNEKYYDPEDITGMIMEKEVKEPGLYFAIGANGRAYRATYTDRYFNGVFFFCIPYDVEIIGYVPA